MADQNLSSSVAPSSVHNMHQEYQLLSPTRDGHGGKERRQPSITPRKFRRFFTPRTRVSARPSAARRALRDLTARALNHSEILPTNLYTGETTPPTVPDNGVLDFLPSPRSAKRRKTGHQTPETSPLKPTHTAPSIQMTTPELVSKVTPSSMLLSPLNSSPVALADEPMSDIDDLDGSEESGPEIPLYSRPLHRIRPLTHLGTAGQLLQRELGAVSRPGRQIFRCPITDWRAETADFCSSRDDVHLCASHEAPSGRCIPFCTASCNTNGLVAIGDEEGRIRLLDSDMPGPDGFNNVHISFTAHSNAVIDLAFSHDDYLLATASGDQTGKVIDMMTQTPISILDHHTASLKQIRFQPGRGDGNVLATSGRDGSVKIWDLRCTGRPTQEFTMERPTSLHYNLPRTVKQGCVVNSIYDAHARTMRQTRQMVQSPSGPDFAARWEVPGRISEVSVTAIQFLPPGKEHLILSACEADASIKLWDIRNIHTSRQKTTTPISITAAPESHSQWRPFGISSMSLGTDGARLYALCKDNTVYAYSTSHLILGYAPELSSKGDPPKRRHGTAQEGLGPMYGFRHENFHATSFYVKTAVRPARDGRSELLAVGSSDGCAILFPTDERYFTDPDSHMLVGSRKTGDHAHGPTATLSSFTPPSLVRSPGSGIGPRRQGVLGANSVFSLNGRLVDTIPMIRNGTPLIRGHEKKEVGAVCWTPQGNLVSVGDDYLVRCWREDRKQATDLRTGGEGEGRRWASGWADAGDGWDDDEGCLLDDDDEEGNI